MGAAAVSTGSELLSAKLQANAIRAQADWEARAAEFNADNIALQRKEVGKIASEEITDRQREVRAMLGMQKAQLAASGIDLGSELAGDIESDTRQIGQEDVFAIENNAWRQAWGLKLQESEARTRARTGRASAKQQEFYTLATGGLRGLGSIASFAAKD